jgi:hypothetical protein
VLKVTSLLNAILLTQCRNENESCLLSSIILTQPKYPGGLTSDLLAPGKIQDSLRSLQQQQKINLALPQVIQVRMKGREHEFSKMSHWKEIFFEEKNVF